jgi:hypothetical protein
MEPPAWCWPLRLLPTPWALRLCWRRLWDSLVAMDKWLCLSCFSFHLTKLEGMITMWPLVTVRIPRGPIYKHSEKWICFLRLLQQMTTDLVVWNNTQSFPKSSGSWRSKSTVMRMKWRWHLFLASHSFLCCCSYLAWGCILPPSAPAVFLSFSLPHVTQSPSASLPK